MDRERVLIHTPDKDLTWWALPGGGPELGESSAETIAREMREELSEEIRVLRPLWFLETFYRDEQTLQGRHEISLVYEIELARQSLLLNATKPFEAGIEEYGQLTYWWLPLNMLDESFPLYPRFFRSGLLNLPPTFEHIIYNQPDDN